MSAGAALGGADVTTEPEGQERRRGGSGAILGLIGLIGGTAFGWWAAGGPWPDATTLQALGQPVPAAAAGQAAPAVTPVSSVPAIDGNQSALRAALARGDTLTIGVFGDSMADGLWAGLYRRLNDLEGVEVVRFSRPSTGLARYDYVDVGEQTAEQLAERKIDIAVFIIGANDRQSMAGDGVTLPFGEAAWREAYGRRTDALVAQARAHGAAVYWVGLPRMRSSGAENGAELVNGIFDARAEAGGYPFIDTTAVTSDANDAYAAYLPTGRNGARQLVRASDGIHMTMNGYLVLAEPVERAIRADLDQARAAVAPRRSTTPPAGSEA